MTIFRGSLCQLTQRYVVVVVEAPTFEVCFEDTPAGALFYGGALQPVIDPCGNCVAWKLLEKE